MLWWRLSRKSRLVGEEEGEEGEEGDEEGREQPEG